MQVVRIYTGEDGKSHFEDLNLSWEKVRDSQRTAVEKASSFEFRRVLPGHFNDFHPAPKRQYVVNLEGQAEVGVGDGSKRIFSPGDVLLVEDLTGQGHTTRVVGDKPRISVWIPLA